MGVRFPREKSWCERVQDWPYLGSKEKKTAWIRLARMPWFLEGETDKGQIDH